MHIQWKSMGQDILGFLKAIILIPLYKNALFELYSCLKNYSIVIFKNVNDVQEMETEKPEIVNWWHGLIRKSNNRQSVIFTN